MQKQESLLKRSFCGLRIRDTHMQYTHGPLKEITLDNMEKPENPEFSTDTVNEYLLLDKKGVKRMSDVMLSDLYRRTLY
jgi:hypothetical protein